MAPEILRMILESASPATLSACTCVSLALLEIASPLLYHAVTLESEAQTSKLFCRLVRVSFWRTLLPAFADALLGEAGSFIAV